MPSALETLVKILKLEQDTGYQDKAVIGGLRSFSTHWTADAHAQARKPEHHLLIDELAERLNAYGDLSSPGERHESIKYMLGRIMGRIPVPGAAAAAPAAKPEAPPPPTAPPAPRADQPRQPDRQQWQQQQQSQQRQPPIPRPPVVEQAIEQAGDQAGLRAPVAEAPLPVQAAPEPQPSPVEPPQPPAAPLDRLPGDQGQQQGQQTVAPEAPPIAYDRGQVEQAGRQGPQPEAAGTTAAPRPPEPTRSAAPARRRRGLRDPQRDGEVLRALKAPVSTVSGIGSKIAEKLAHIGVRSIDDLLYCFPRRYDDYTRMVPLNKLEPGQTVTVIGTVRSSTIIKGRRGQEVLNVTVDDGSDTLTISFFGQPYLRNKLERGVQVVFSGKTDLFRGRITMNNPEWEMMEREALHTRAIVPVYPLTRGLSAHNMRRFTRSIVEQWTSQLPDYMPESVLERTDMPDLGWAIQQIHFPASWDSLQQGRHRLVFDELLLLQLGVMRNRRDWQSVPGDPMPVGDDWVEAFAAALPYALTGAQTRSIQAIREDMARAVPMNRLLQGDVGSGKTVVAVLAMTIAVMNGHQAAIMAPTGILAEQHYRGISRLIQSTPGGENIHVRLLTSATPAQERADILWGLGEGSVHLIVGTHALLEEEVSFNRLGLVVVDEQHRFGVAQRGRLRGKGINPHVLIMTATPIPRTLALTMYADLDLTVLDEMPPGRTPIDTRVLLPKERERAYSFIDAQINKGRQAFVVYPLVEASENEAMAEVRSAVEEFERLQQEVFPTRRLGLLHGRLPPAEKDGVMLAFSRGELDVLVSTSVVEVGIDVPNASVMLIEGANRFGLAQLHQFRGRVGRGEHPSYCLLVPDSGEMDNARLQAMESTTDGFKLAEIDWEMRGAGELLGTRQSGGPARLGEYMDVRTVEQAQFEARTLYEEDPDLRLPEHEALRERLRASFGERTDADVS
jgi:ATP-dependent DNA helicase RecG